MDSEELQGFAIADPYAPFIFVNSDDWNAPQLFTLVHELAHLWVAETGISNKTDPELKNQSKFHPVELFCNKVAANALMPEENILSHSQNSYRQSKELFKTAKAFGVSSFALLVRALNLGLVTVKEYAGLKEQVEKDYLEFLDREAVKRENQKNNNKKGGPNYFLLQLNRNNKNQNPQCL